ncbi:hypothetical protein C8R48DRAFT_676166 [Suillus tomentosus]|nr:hypothetical protein C8R48DRAFT_676166 [Suillus tomentosus]
MSLNDELIEQQRMASRADATTLEDNHDCEEIMCFVDVSSLFYQTGVDLLALTTSALSLLAPRKQTKCDDATPDPAGTEERTEWKLATPAEQGQRSTPKPPLCPDLDDSDHRCPERGHDVSGGLEDENGMYPLISLSSLGAARVDVDRGA